MSTIGDRIRIRRNELGLSVDDLASKLGKNRATVYRYESNEIENFPVSVINSLATALDVSPAYLMGWKNDLDDNNIIEKTNKPTPEGELQKDVIVLHRNGERIEYHLTEEQLQVVKPLLDQLNAKKDPDF